MLMPSSWRLRLLVASLTTLTTLGLVLASVAGLGRTARAAAMPHPTFWPEPHAGTAQHPGLIKVDWHADDDLAWIGSGVNHPPDFTPIVWSEWGAPTAIGHAGAGYSKRAGKGDIPTKVVISASGIVPCGGVDIYTTLGVALAPGEAPPRGWNFARTQIGTSRQCWPMHGCDEGVRACTVLAFNEFRPYLQKVRGHTRANHAPFSSLTYSYRISFKNWGGPTTEGRGFLVSPTRLGGCNYHAERCEPRIYPVRYVQSDPRWCFGARFGLASVYAGLNYTVSTVEAFGSGRPDSHFFGLPAHRYDGLLREIGRSGIPRYVDHSSLLDLAEPGQRPLKTTCLPDNEDVG